MQKCVNNMTEYRCEFCNRLLCKWSGKEFEIEIACPKCGAIHNFGMRKVESLEDR